MTQSQLDREVARATGESIRNIKRLGFSYLLVPDRGHPTDPAKRDRVAHHRRQNTPHAMQVPPALCAA